MWDLHYQWNIVRISNLVSILYYDFMAHCTLCYDMDIGTMWHCALASCVTSQSFGLVYGRALFLYWVSICVPFTNSLATGYSIMVLAIIIRMFMSMALVLIYIFRFYWIMSLSFCNYAPPRMFLLLEILFEYWIEHGMLPSGSFLSC